MKRKYLIFGMSMMFLSACSVKPVGDMVPGTEEKNAAVVAETDDKKGMEEREGMPESQGSDSMAEIEQEVELTPISIDETNFPDQVLRKYVSDSFDRDQDGILNAEERKNATEISCINEYEGCWMKHMWDKVQEPDLQFMEEEGLLPEGEVEYIESLQGIELLPNLQIITCRNQHLSTVDIQKNTTLSHLDLAGNQLSSLDLASNTALSYLDCEGNKLSSLDVSANTNLVTLYCDRNEIETLDLSKNLNLQEIDVSANPLARLNISKCAVPIDVVRNGYAFASDEGDKVNYSLEGGSLRTDYEDLIFAGDLKDVSEDAEYSDAVYFVCNKFYMNPFSEGIFEPERAMYRASFVTALYNVAGNPEVSYTNSFRDVMQDVWYARPVMWATQNKITSGISEDLFGVEKELTHEQLLSILYKYAAKVGCFDMTANKDALDAYSDKTQIEDWAVEAMQWAVSTGIIEGKKGEKGNVLDPKGISTRAECAQILYNLLMKTLDPGKSSFVTNISTGKVFTCKEEPVIESGVDKVALAEANRPEGAIVISETNFPDPTFRQYVIDKFDMDDDRILKKDALERVDCIDFENWFNSTDWKLGQVRSLQGIEFFPNLVNLICDYQDLEILDLSKNIKLEKLSCCGNLLTKINVSENAELVELNCYHNQLTELDVSHNSKLRILRCQENHINKLDVSKNSELTNLECGDNNLTELNVENNPKLELLVR